MSLPTSFEHNDGAVQSKDAPHENSALADFLHDANKAMVAVCINGKMADKPPLPDHLDMNAHPLDWGAMSGKVLGNENVQTPNFDKMLANATEGKNSEAPPTTHENVGNSHANEAQASERNAEQQRHFAGAEAHRLNAEAQHPTLDTQKQHPHLDMNAHHPQLAMHDTARQGRHAA